MKTLYVGNLAFSATESDIENLFSEQGTVHSCKLIVDRDTGKSRGFAFVEMDDEQAQNAIVKLNGAMLGGRPLRVNEARERRER
ncbi:MAG: RNA-binding protein [Kiritimatiellae bacterium]|nr:RNA-binding protein [Kiritimatiellia bacterium]